MMWVTYLVIATIAIEALVIWFHHWTKQNAPDYSLWVVMGAKVFKLLIAVIAIVAVNVLSDEISIKQFSVAVILAYLAGLIIETIFFLQKKK